jgi:hypothetical protein
MFNVNYKSHSVAETISIAENFIKNLARLVQVFVVILSLV